jgi:hypothetical protein
MSSAFAIEGVNVSIQEQMMTLLSFWELTQLSTFLLKTKLIQSIKIESSHEK